VQRRAVLFCLASLVAGCGGSSANSSSAAAVASGGDRASSPAEAAIAAAVSASHRSAENRARDVYRHPAETLAFFGLREDMTVVEMSPSGGWFTEILAPVLRERGRLIGAVPDSNGPGARYAQAFTDRMARDPQVFDRVQTIVFQPPTHTSLGPDGSVDMIVTFRSFHGWINNGQVETVLGAMFRALKPGGILGIEQHRAAPDADVTQTSPKGYVPEAYVIAAAQAAGFELAGRSEINANPRDTRDYEEGVWALPPTLRRGEVDRDRLMAIGETDRMTLRFVKPR
jgi:predicted methyltransferase